MILARALQISPTFLLMPEIVRSPRPKGVKTDRTAPKMSLQFVQMVVTASPL